MVTPQKKTIDDLLRELDLSEEEKAILDRVLEWTKEDLAKWLLFHFLAKGRLAALVSTSGLPKSYALESLFGDYFPGLCTFASLMGDELDAIRQSKSLETLRN